MGPVDWDERHASQDEGLWSGRVNGALVAEVAGLPPGRALDVGCGEGADAIWLARAGWQATGVDISEVALERAAEGAHEAGVSLEWVCADNHGVAATARRLHASTKGGRSKSTRCGYASIRRPKGRPTPTIRCFAPSDA